MKILQYLPGLPPVMGGGLIKYALDLIWGLEMLGHEVIMLVPGNFTFFNRDRVRIAKGAWRGRVCYRIINPLPVSCGRGVQDVSKLMKIEMGGAYENFLRKVSPDIIHLHSFMGLHKSFLEAACKVGIPIIYTTHDYYGICPNAILLSGAEQCIVDDGSQCPYCVQRILSEKRLIMQQSNIYKFLKGIYIINYLEYSPNILPFKIFIREFVQSLKRKKKELYPKIQNMQKEKLYRKLKYYYKEMFGLVTRFHYNSSQSQELFMKYLGDVSGDVISISNKSILDRRKKKHFGKTLKIGFIGRGEHKGFGLLKTVLDSIYAKGMRDLECHIYFNPKEKLPPYMISHEPYKEEVMDQVYNKIDLLVLPSIWKETYGLVVLEALSYGVPVIVSRNVGAKELLSMYDGIGIVVESTVESLRKELVKIYQNRKLLIQMNLEICNCGLELNYEEHVRRIICMYRMSNSSDKSQIYKIKEREQ